MLKDNIIGLYEREVDISYPSNSMQKAAHKAARDTGVDSDSHTITKEPAIIFFKNKKQVAKYTKDMKLVVN